VSSRVGERHLVIREVKLSDAGLFIARDAIHGLEASANLTVIGQLPHFYSRYYVIILVYSMSGFMITGGRPSTLC